LNRDLQAGLAYDPAASFELEAKAGCEIALVSH
jgi:hypothetical protein